VKKLNPIPVVSAFSWLFPVKFLQKVSGINTIFPFYHTVSDRSLPHIKHLYHIKTTKEFKADLDFLLKHFTPIEPGELLNKNIKRNDKPSFLLTFDDGLREIKEIVAPILLDKGLKAIFFVNNDFIDNKDMLYRCKASLIVEELKTKTFSEDIIRKAGRLFEIANVSVNHLIKNILNISFSNRKLLNALAELFEVDFDEFTRVHRPYLSAADINELKDMGFSIGAHSSDHRELHLFKDDKIVNEIKESITGISKQFNISCRYFSFPFTDTGISINVMRQIHDPVNPVADASFGTSGMKINEEFPVFQRIPVEKSKMKSCRYIKAEYLYYMMKAIVQKHRIKR